MKTTKKDVGFIYSIRAKLLLMGGISIVSVCVLSLIMLNLISRVNKDAKFTAQINKVNQYQAESETLKTTYYYSMTEDILHKMYANLQESKKVMDASKNLAAGSNREKYNAVMSDINKSSTNLNQIIKLSKERGFTRNKALYAEFLKDDNSATSLFTTKTKEDAWVDVSIDKFPVYAAGSTSVEGKNYSVFQFKGDIPKKGKRKNLILRMGGQAADYTGTVYINNIVLTKQGKDEVYDLNKLSNSDLSNSYGTALTEYDLTKFKNVASIVAKIKCTAANNTWEDAEIMLPIDDIDIEQYDKIRFDVYAPQDQKYAKMSLGAAIEGKVDFATLYDSINEAFLNYTRHIANGDDVTKETDAVNELFKKINEDIASYVPNATLNKQLTDIVKEKQDTFNKILEKDKEILKLRQQNARINENLTGTTTDIKTDIEQAMQNRQALAVIIAALTLVIIIAVISVTTLLISKNINSRLTQFGGMLAELSEGNLNVRADQNSKDEFGLFSKQMNEFVARLSNVLAHIQLLINEVTNKNLVVANTMKQVAKGDFNDYDVIDEGILYLKKLSDQVTESVMTQGANTEESLASLNEQVDVNTGILNKVDNIKDFSAKTFDKVAEIQREVKALNHAMEVLNTRDSEKVRQLIQDTGVITKNLSIQMNAITSMTAQNSKDMENLHEAVKQQNTSFKGITDAIEQISNEAMSILDKAQTTNRVANDISKELIDGVETLDEIITSSEELRGDVAFFKIEDQK